MTAPVIDIRDLVVVRGSRAVLDDVSVPVTAGRVTGLLGPSGAGKSTLMRAIVGVQEIHAGAVHVLGRRAGTPQLRGAVGYMTQAPCVYGDLTVRENLRFFARLLSVTNSSVDEAVEIVRLESHADQLVRTLSGGEQARVSLATALLGDPPVLVLDEPTVGLDPVLRSELWDIFGQLADRGRTLLVSSHVMDEAERCADLLLLREGKLFATGSPESLRQRTGARTLDDAFLRLVRAGGSR